MYCIITLIEKPNFVLANKSLRIDYIALVKGQKIFPRSGINKQ